MVTTNPRRNYVQKAGVVPSDRVAHRPKTLSTGGRKYELESDWKPIRRSLQPDNRVEPDAFEQDSCSEQLQSDANQEMTDLLRSQIARLLEENEKILTSLDDYRNQLMSLRREQKESAIDPSAEMMTLQTELGESRLREAELTIALGELQDRITAIDRMIETDPEMESFFNAVTISTTTLSKTQPIQRTSQNQPEPPISRNPSHGKSTYGSVTQVYKSEYSSGTTCSDRRSSAKLGNYSCAQVGRCSSQVSADADTPELSHQSGLESPQSDSGCSLNSHALSDATDQINGFDEPESKKTKNQIFEINHSLENEPYREHGFTVDREFSNLYPRKAATLLRRSRSSATEQTHSLGFYNELNSPVSVISKDNMAFRDPNFDDALTPTDERHTSNHADTMGTTQSDVRWTSGDRFSKLRASFRRSFGLGPAKPDFRIEAFAARQGEARALLSLRETRMELLRVQSRCQTLQRHMERLEAINISRMEELEAAAIGDRELRQDIREMQRRIFQLEAEHREFKVNQRIKEMELMSRLAEANLRLSQAEMSYQQDTAWIELNKAHEAASDLLTPTHSPPDRCHPNSTSLLDGPGPDPHATDGVVKVRPTFEHSITKMESGRYKKDQDQPETETRTSSRHSIHDKLSANVTEHSMKKYPNDRYQSQIFIDQSLGSLSDLCLHTDQSVASPGVGIAGNSIGYKAL